MYIQGRSLTCSITIRNTPSSQKRNVSPHTTPLRMVRSQALLHTTPTAQALGDPLSRHRYFGTIVDGAYPTLFLPRKSSDSLLIWVIETGLRKETRHREREETQLHHRVPNRWNPQGNTYSLRTLSIPCSGCPCLVAGDDLAHLPQIVGVVQRGKLA
jgi:hypothetical protein